MAGLPNKDWYRSKTVWSAVAAAFVAIVTAMYGETSEMTAIVIALLSAAGLYGRLTATTSLK